MAFEVFEKQGRMIVRDPSVTVGLNGQLRFNRACDDKWLKSKDATHVLLMFDRQRGLIGLRPCGEGVAHACPLRDSKAGRTCSAISFLRYYEVDFSKTKVYPARWDEQANAIVLDLREGKASAAAKKTSKGA